MRKFRRPKAGSPTPDQSPQNDTTNRTVMYRMTIALPGHPLQVEVFRSPQEAWEWMRAQYLDDWDLASGTDLSPLYSETYRASLNDQDTTAPGVHVVGDRVYQIETATTPYPRYHPEHHNQVHQGRLVENVTHLLKSTRPDEIAARLGYADPENLRTALNRIGRKDLAERFVKTAWDPMVEVNRNHKETPHTAVRDL